MPFKERWPEQALQVMKEEMLAEVASPAIPPGLRLKTKQEEKIQARVQSRERKTVNVRARTPVFGLVCVLLYQLPSVPSTGPRLQLRRSVLPNGQRSRRRRLL